jgi:hypothetical protein
MRKIILLLSLVSLLALTACSAPVVDPEDVETDQTNQVRRGQNSQDLTYDIDEHDFINHNELLTDIEVSDLSEDEKAGLILMREEEKLARDVYQALGDLWGQKIFTNIARSEDTHTESVKTLLDRYDIEDPVSEDVAGVFHSEELQGLYDALVAQGSESLEAALTVGATVEDLDISDLNKLLDETDNEDIIMVYENLLKGSRNHLRAFTRNLENQGATYTAQYISAEEYQAILDSDQESGYAQQGSSQQYRGGRNRR